MNRAPGNKYWRPFYQFSENRFTCLPLTLLRKMIIFSKYLCSCLKALMTHGTAIAFSEGLSYKIVFMTCMHYIPLDNLDWENHL